VKYHLTRLKQHLKPGTLINTQHQTRRLV